MSALHVAFQDSFWRMMLIGAIFLGGAAGLMIVLLAVSLLLRIGHLLYRLGEKIDRLSQ